MSLSRKSRKNIRVFNQIQYSPVRSKYMVSYKTIVDRGMEAWAKIQEENKNHD